MRRRRLRPQWWPRAAVVVVVAVVATGSSDLSSAGPVVPAPDLKVAFLGDQGLGQDAKDVLALIRAEDADLVVHTGDLDYTDNPAAWDAQVTEVLGTEVPYFIAMGNHEGRGTPGVGGGPAWDGPQGYQRVASERVAGLPGVECEGDYGVRAVCTYRGLWLLLSGVSLDGAPVADHASYIERECGLAPHVWKIANWHRNQTAMQVGDQPDHVGWGVYEQARACGAIVSTAHEHSYARTRTLTSTVRRTVDPECPGATALCVGPGRTFVFHSGLGGRSVREQERCLPARFPYGCRGEWAHIYTDTQDATFGALFLTFHVDGDPMKAEGYFKTIDGRVVDSFTITASVQGDGQQQD